MTGAAAAGSSTGFLEQNAGEQPHGVPSSSCRLERGRSCLLPVLPRLVCVQEGRRCPLLQPGLRRGPGEEHSERGWGWLELGWPQASWHQDAVGATSLLPQPVQAPVLGDVGSAVGPGHTWAVGQLLCPCQSHCWELSALSCSPSQASHHPQELTSAPIFPYTISLPLSRRLLFPGVEGDALSR